MPTQPTFRCFSVLREAQDALHQTKLVGNGVAFHFAADLIWLRNDKVGAGVWDGEGEKEVDCADCKVHVGWVDEYLLFSFFL